MNLWKWPKIKKKGSICRFCCVGATCAAATRAPNESLATKNVFIRIKENDWCDYHAVIIGRGQRNYGDKRRSTIQLGEKNWSSFLPPTVQHSVVERNEHFAICLSAGHRQLYRLFLFLTFCCRRMFIHPLASSCKLVHGCEMIAVLRGVREQQGSIF